MVWVLTFFFYFKIIYLFLEYKTIKFHFLNFFFLLEVKDEARFSQLNKDIFESVIEVNF